MHRPDLLPSYPAGSLLRAGLGAALVAVGLSVVPLPKVTGRRLPRRPRTAPLRAHGRGPGSAVHRRRGRLAGRRGRARFVTIGVALPERRHRQVAGWSDWHELEVEVDKGPDQSTDEGAKAAQHRNRGRRPSRCGSAMPTPTRCVSRGGGGIERRNATSTTTTSAPIDGAGPEVVVVRPDGQRLEVASDSVPAGAQSVGQPAIRTRGEWGARAPSNSVGTASFPQARRSAPLGDRQRLLAGRRARHYPLDPGIPHRRQRLFPTSGTTSSSTSSVACGKAAAAACFATASAPTPRASTRARSV